MESPIVFKNSLSSRIDGKPEITLMDVTVTSDGFKDCAKAEQNPWGSNTD